jgi:dsDNA-specific endonuclease/ATPase MutS2
MATDDGEPDPDEVVEPELGDSIDLHTFQPRDCGDVVEEYVRAAREAGMTIVRIIHGKGTGTLRRITHGVLAKHPDVQSYRLDETGNWGATIVELRPAEPRLAEPPARTSSTS